MFGRKLEPQGPSTMGGRLLMSGDAAARGMPYCPTGEPPFIKSDGIVTTEPLGVMTSRCIEGGGPVLAAWQSQINTPARQRSWRRNTLDERLERLGVRAGGRSLQRTRVFDLPL